VAALRIAVADDEPQVREYFKKILPLMGHEVVAAAANGRELLESCLALRPDLVITDINMSELNGIEAASAIWREQAVPVIFVSAYSDAKKKTLAVEKHAPTFLVKPIKRQDLEAAIQRIIGRAGQSS
jgi:YesN/AraC family two-component response regulator